MKLGILTFHRALNYGAVLQTYALQKALENCGAEAEVIDYRAPFNEKRFQKKTLKDVMHIRTLYGILFQNSYKLYERSTFDSFVDKIPHSSAVNNTDELQLVCREYDRIVCGSDQVWNLACTENDDSYFLPFIDDLRKKTSYAASIGYSKLPEQYRDKYKRLISGYSAISVREKEGVEIVKDVSGRTATYVVDPTLLLNRNEWISIANYERVPKFKYVLLYLMSEDKILISYARKYAKENHCKVVYINDRLFKLNGAVNFRKVTPEEWIGLFDKAECIFTNSFHGTTFSINLRKHFYIRYIPRSVANSRLKCILEDTGLEKREIDHFSGEKIDYNRVDLLLNNRITESYQYIREQILEC